MLQIEKRRLSTSQLMRSFEMDENMQAQTPHRLTKCNSTNLLVADVIFALVASALLLASILLLVLVSSSRLVQHLPSVSGTHPSSH